MRNNLSLNLIYRYETKIVDGNPKGHYRLVYLFSEAGFVEKETMLNFYKQFQAEFSEEFIFENLDQLGEFALKICIDLKAPEVFVLSTQDYNTGMETVRDVRGFKEVFRRFGNCLSNPEIHSEKSSLLGNIFKK